MAVLAMKSDLAEELVAAWPEPKGEADWAREARSKALARLRQQGLPIKRDEYWRFTDPSSFTQIDVPEAADFRSEKKQPFHKIDAVRAVFVDGVFKAELSDDLSGGGFEIETLTSALKKDIHWAKGLFGVLEAKGQLPVARPLAGLNTVKASEGLIVRVASKATKALSLIYRHENSLSDAMIHHVIKLEPGAELTVLESGPGAARLNTCAEVDVAEGASFHHVRLQGRDRTRRAATHLFARLGRKSRFRSFTLTMNGALTRNECVVEFTGDNASAHVAGACVGDGAFHHDDTVFITHDALNCESRQVFKKVLRNGAVGVFQGKILVKKAAQKTDGYQISQGLLLDEGSQFLAKPELEIYADDVVCSHGSTCGAVDATALFYLTSRGVPKPVAEGMLVLAFLDQAIAEIEDATLAEDIRARLSGWMTRHS